MRWARPIWRAFQCLTSSGAAEARLFTLQNFVGCVKCASGARRHLSYLPSAWRRT